MAELSEDNELETEAAHWVAVQSGEQPFDRAGFEAWLAGDPRRGPVFDTMWRHIMGPDMDDALTIYGTRQRSRRKWMATGAAGVLALVGGYAAWPSAELFMARPQEYAAADGSVRNVALDDGTRLTLAGGARVRVRYTRHDRVVDLTRGTIFVDVTHDEHRPFRIEAGAARITDLGTRFEVARKPSSVRVTVASGAVRLGSSNWFGERIDLSAHQAATMNGAVPGRISNVPADEVARWRQGWVEYRDVSMEQVVRDLESVSPVPIRIADKAVGNLRVSGRIRLIDPIRQVNNLSLIHGFAVDRREDAIVLSSGKAGSQPNGARAGAL